MFDLNGKVAFVAGGAGYLGTAVCRALAEHGASVAVADCDRERLDGAVKDVAAFSSGDKVLGIHFDIGDEASIKDAVAGTLERFGRLNVMVNATCSSVGKVVEDLGAEEFDRANRINITGSFVLARDAAQAMPADGGGIIMFTSMYGLVSPDPRIYHAPMNPNPIEYGAGKAAMIQMVRYLAVHYGSDNIRVNAVAPGPFPNPTVQQKNPDFIRRLEGRVPLGRIGRPGDVAGAVVFLASDEASYITGHVLRVDGGWTAW